MSRSLFRERVRTEDGARLEVQVQGNGPTLLMLAGQANNHTWWNSVRRDYAALFTTVTIDYRGTGASDLGPSPLSTRLLADDAMAALDALSLSRAHVFGTSMGGRVAQWIAAGRPDRVGRLVLGCTTPGGRHAVERDAGVRRSLIADNSADHEILASLMYGPEYRLEHPGPYNTLGDPTMTPEARAAHLRASAEHDAWAALPGIESPTLVLHGAEDMLAPVANADLLTTRIPHAQQCVFRDARHAFFEERREETGLLVADFLLR